MTLGDGIFYSTLLLIFAAAIYQISIRHKWKLVGKALGALALFGAVIGGGVWAWIEYQDRPVVVTELWGVELGMTPTEVTLAKGTPSNGADEQVGDGQDDLGWTYYDEYDKERFTFVRFQDEDGSGTKVSIVCRRKGYDNLLGLKYRDEDEIIATLGESFNVSISADGLRKMLSFPTWNVAYEFERGSVVTECIFSGDKGIGYNNENAEQDEETRPPRDLLSTEAAPPTPDQ